MTRSFLTLAVGLLLAGSPPAWAQDQTDPGPAIGSTIANFSLTDQSGQDREWKQFLGKGPVAVVFHRSAEW